MSQERLYKIQELGGYEDFDRADIWESSNPKGWREFAKAHPKLDDDADFFIPRRVVDRVYRSRSSAKENLERYFTRWGIDARIVECTPQWESIPDANARRARERTRA